MCIFYTSNCFIPQILQKITLKAIWLGFFFCVLYELNHLYTCKYEILQELVYGAFWFCSMVWFTPAIPRTSLNQWDSPKMSPTDTLTSFTNTNLGQSPNTILIGIPRTHAGIMVHWTFPPSPFSLSLENRECTLQTQCDSGFF